MRATIQPELKVLKLFLYHSYLATLNSASVKKSIFSKQICKYFLFFFTDRLFFFRKSLPCTSSARHGPCLTLVEKATDAIPTSGGAGGGIRPRSFRAPGPGRGGTGPGPRALGVALPRVGRRGRPPGLAAEEGSRRGADSGAEAYIRGSMALGP